MNGGPSLNPPSSVFITVKDRDQKVTYFNDKVGFGDIFTVLKPAATEFADRLRITVSTVNGNAAGTPLQSLELRVTCKGNDDISLLARYGSLQLTVYKSAAQGYQSAFENLELTFIV
jgi:hypothetical protein